MREKSSGVILTCPLLASLFCFIDSEEIRKNLDRRHYTETFKKPFCVKPIPTTNRACGKVVENYRVMIYPNLC